MPKLIHILTEGVVLTALQHMHSTSSAGLDGIPSSIYQHTAAVFAPQMLGMIERMLQAGVVPEALSLAIKNCITKRLGSPEVSALRPICL